MPGIDEKTILASLLGGAIGDTVGADIEFLTYDEIIRRPPGSAWRVSEDYGVYGAITDDTQMTLFTAEGIIEAANRDADLIDCVQAALIRWYDTQRGISTLTGLASDPRLIASRAPGMSCLRSLKLASEGGKAVAGYGCGTIMRVAPVGLAFDDNVFQIAKDTSKLTHDTEIASCSAAVWAVLINKVAHGQDFEKALEDVVFGKCVPKRTKVMRMIVSNLKAVLEADISYPTHHHIEQFGQGFYAEEALFIATYACRAAKTFEDGIIIATHHGGDSDSVGAIAGNMLGMMFPLETMTSKWAQQVECLDVIEKIANQLHNTRNK